MPSRQVKSNDRSWNHQSSTAPWQKDMWGVEFFWNLERIVHENPRHNLEYKVQQWLPNVPSIPLHFLCFYILQYIDWQVSSGKLALVFCLPESPQYKSGSPIPFPSIAP